MELLFDGIYSLSILEVFFEDSGNYRCVVRNKVGEIICGFLFKV